MYINKTKLNLKRFSSKELKLLKSTLNGLVIDGKVEILHTNEYSMFELLFIIDYYISNNILVDLILSYLPYQRMDHKESEEVCTIRHIANIFNNIKLNSLTICEPHCQISYFTNAKEFSYINALKNRIFAEIKFNEELDTIVLTDKGACRRYSHVAKNFAYGNKLRDPNSGLIIKHELVGEINSFGKVLIIDDIISSGDTIVNIIDMLTKKGITQIYVLSGHIENNKYNKRIYQNNNVQKVFSTNSLRKTGNKKLKLYNVKEIYYGKN